MTRDELEQFKSLRAEHARLTPLAIEVACTRFEGSGVPGRVRPNARGKSTF